LFAKNSLIPDARDDDDDTEVIGEGLRLRESELSVGV
jgi:hypothetical protein